ncbi:hypothetical protein [Halorussus lipolyticus]|uniref:hypothetical protein n=1 Tax=Halorussus lipolyticus TaxID=3034024 RepID=UPI0023E7DB1B|nr:hypothetical protein [Halorussus sp. DT80]
MRHEHLVVTVEAGRKERIDADLDAGESLEAWVADAIDQKLARQSRSESAEGDADSSAGGGSPPADDSDGDRAGTDSDREGDDYDEGFEYVDDCGI